MEKLIKRYVDEKGKEWGTYKIECPKCGGLGFLERIDWKMTDNEGRCFKCMGTGYIVKDKRILTEKEKTQREKAEIRRREKKEAEQLEKIRVAEEKKQEEYRKSMIRKYGEKYGNCIAKGEICIGMTKEMCKETLGIPHHTNKTTDILGEVEVWTYISNWAESVFFKIEEEEYMFVTFMDGKVTSITE